MGGDRGGWNSLGDFIDRYNLLNIPLSGTQFTWSNFQERPAVSKLDRFLISVGWEDLFSPIKAPTLSRLGSDHMPLVLQCGVARSGLTPLRFQAMWLLKPGFLDQVSEWRCSFEVERPPDQRFCLKLKLLRDRQKVWNKEVFGKIEVRKEAILKDIWKFDLKEISAGLSEGERTARNILRDEYERVLSMEDAMWHQKSRI